MAELKVLFAELSVPRDHIIEYIEQGNDDEALTLYVKSYLPKVEIVKRKLEAVANSCVEDARYTMDSVQADNSRGVDVYDRDWGLLLSY